MPINLGGFSFANPDLSSDTAAWKTAAGNVGKNFGDTQTNLINAIKGTGIPEGKTQQQYVQECQVEFDKAKQMFELFQAMFKSASDIIMNLIRRLDPR
jgi:hypothetical protein